MTEDIQLSQTLREALEAEKIREQQDPLKVEKIQQQINLLNVQAADLTVEAFIKIVNELTFDGLEKETLEILRKIAIIRVKIGLPVFPWYDEAFLSMLEEDWHGLVY
jgi:hypothetical protein